jgi:hypothetical protein
LSVSNVAGLVIFFMAKSSGDVSTWWREANRAAT